MRLYFSGLLRPWSRRANLRTGRGGWVTGLSFSHAEGPFSLIDEALRLGRATCLADRRGSEARGAIALAHRRGSEAGRAIALAHRRGSEARGAIALAHRRGSEARGAIALAHRRGSELRGAIALAHRRGSEARGAIALAHRRGSELRGAIALAHRRGSEARGPHRSVDDLTGSAVEPSSAANRGHGWGDFGASGRAPPGCKHF
jgi:hypothetical protein